MRKKNLGKELSDVASKGRSARRKKWDPELSKAPMREGLNTWDIESRRVQWNVIRRWLQSKVGQNWDDVYSEFCREAKHYQRHYMENYVELNTHIYEERVMVRRCGTVHEPTGFWVHPITKQLNFTDYRRWRKTPMVKPLFDNWYLKTYEGILFVVKMERLTPAAYLITEDPAKWWPDNMQQWVQLVPTQHRQLTSEEIKKYKLKE